MVKSAQDTRPKAERAFHPCIQQEDSDQTFLNRLQVHLPYEQQTQRFVLEEYTTFSSNEA